MVNEENANTIYHAGQEGRTLELIRQRAHQIWEENGCIDGHDVDDWLQAEHEITGSMAQASAA